MLHGYGPQYAKRANFNECDDSISMTNADARARSLTTNRHTDTELTGICINVKNQQFGTIFDFIIAILSRVMGTYWVMG